jgi:hypothetical protein
MTRPNIHQAIGAGLIAAVVAGLAACGDDAPTASPATTKVATTKPAATPASSPAMTLPVGGEPVTLNPADFTTDITHPYWPMKPGTRYTYEEAGDEGPMKVVIVVTDMTKTVAMGIETRVVRDTVYDDEGLIVEDTFDFYAQDSAGNLWYFGEDTAEFEDGEMVNRNGAFEAGVDGALPGVQLPAVPTPGLAYRQEYYKGHAEDNGKILAVDASATVPFGTYSGDVLQTEDTNALEPDVIEHKFYAKGVGLVRASKVEGGTGEEVLLSVDQAPAGDGTGPLGDPNG